jgi:hypothetical protein
MRLPPRAVRVIHLNDGGLPEYPGLLLVEAHTRLVFSIAPNTKMDFVRQRRSSPVKIICVSLSRCFADIASTALD